MNSRTRELATLRTRDRTNINFLTLAPAPALTLALALALGRFGSGRQGRQKGDDALNGFHEG